MQSLKISFSTRDIFGHNFSAKAVRYKPACMFLCKQLGSELKFISRLNIFKLEVATLIEYIPWR